MFFTRNQYSGSMSLDLRQLVPQPGFCRGPLALYSGGGNAQKLRDLLDLETAEESQFDYVDKLWIDHSKTIEGFIKGEKLEVVPDSRPIRFGEVNATERVAAFIRSSPAHRIHQNATHELGGGAKEVVAALPVE